MKYIVLILIVFLSFVTKAQIRYPTGFPTQFNSGWNKWGYAQSDSGLIVANRDTNWLPKYSGTLVFKPSNKKFYWFDSTNLTWNVFASTIDTTSLSNRINLKLNIADTTNKWWGLGKRWVDTVYRKNDSTIGFTINNGTEQTFQILGRSSSGGGTGTVTSVALSMPSAFSVSGSPITTNGTFNISGAGTTAQYIRGNGTLATTDTGMIPNFYLKVRGLISGASPITFNQTTGIIGIPNANNTGQKGAATFNNTDFVDDGTGLISLRNPAAFPGVDSIWRVPGVDSIYFTINSNRYTILDSLGATVTANNGLTKSGNNIQLGGTLTQNTTISTTASYFVNVTGSNVQSLQGTNTSNGSGVKGQSVSGSGIFGISTSSNGVYGSSTSGTGVVGESNTNNAYDFNIFPSTTNTLEEVGRTVRYSTGTATNGIGGYHSFYTQSSNGSAQRSNYIASFWSNATTGSRTSQLEFYGVNNIIEARKAALAGNGQWTWDGYPSLTAQTDTNTYKPIAIDGSGNVVKMIGWAGSGGGGATLNNVGSGYRWVATAAGNIKSVFPSPTITWDSTSNSNALTAKVDTSLISTKHDLALVNLQKAFDNGSTLTKHDTIYQANYLLATNGQFINKDTNRMGESGVVLTFGVSTDLGLVTGPIQLPVNWPALVIGNIGYLNWNRASDGSTLNEYAGAGDSSFESKYPYIPNWSPTIRYIILGNYVINEAIHGTDSTTMGASMSKWIDSLIIHRGYPTNRIIVLNGHRSPAVLAAHPLLPLLAIATKNAAINKGVRYFDSYNYTLNNASYNYSDSIHLSIKGQINLALGIMNSGDLDSVNYIQANNIHILKYLTNEGGSKLSGVFNSGNDSTIGRQYIGGNLNLQGSVETVGNFLKGVSIAGDAVFNRRWNLFHDPGFNESWGMQMGGSGPYHTQVYASAGSSANQVQLGALSLDGVTFTSYLSAGPTLSKVSSTSFEVQNTSTFDDNVTMSKGLSIVGDPTANREWNLFNNSFHEKWGMMMGGSAPYYTDIYTSYGDANDAVRLGWRASDGTFTPIFSVRKSGISNIASLTTQTDTTNYKALVVNSSGDIYKMVGWPTGGSATTIYNGDGTLSGNRTVTGSSNSLTFSGINQFRVYSNYLYQAKADGTRLYASAIDPSSTGSQAWQFGYSPFTRGVGLYVDTLNNVGLGDVTQTSMPLYTTGNSAYIRNGLQSQQGDFYSVTNVTTTTTLGVTVNFVTVDATSGNITITLPAASASFGSNMGLDIIFKRLDNSANTITISRAGADLIDGATTFTLTSQYQSKQIRAISSSAWAIY